MKNFASESDVREWLRASVRRHPVQVHQQVSMLKPLWWIEHGHGGTVGLPDAMFMHQGKLIFAELKLARVVKGELRISMSAGQVLALQDLCAFGQEAYVVAGVYGTRELACTRGVNGIVMRGHSTGSRKAFALVQPHMRHAKEGAFEHFFGQ